MKYLLFTIAALTFLSCANNRNTLPVAKITIDKHWLDSVKATCDTFYIKPYARNSDFVTGEYYFNRKDTIVCQFMKDSAGTVRQVIIAKKNITRTFFAEYYANGQLKADYHFDDNGSYDGPAVFYYENGAVKSEGLYSHGLFKGRWKNYDEKGKSLPDEAYDENGQMIKK